MIAGLMAVPHGSTLVLLLRKLWLSPSTSSGRTASRWFRSWWACRTMNGINLTRGSLTSWSACLSRLADCYSTALQAPATRRESPD